MDSYYLEQAVAQAVEEVVLEILELARKGRVQRDHFYIAVYWYRGESDLFFHNRIHAFERGRENWKWDYERYATRKIRVTNRTGLPSDIVYTKRADLLQRGDPLHAGAVRYRKLVIGMSGLAGLEDKHFSRKIGQRAYEKANELAAADKAADIDFVGEEPDKPLHDGPDTGETANYKSFLEEEISKPPLWSTDKRPAMTRARAQQLLTRRQEHQGELQVLYKTRSGDKVVVRLNRAYDDNKAEVAVTRIISLTNTGEQLSTGPFLVSIRRLYELTADEMLYLADRAKLD